MWVLRNRISPKLCGNPQIFGPNWHIVMIPSLHWQHKKELSPCLETGDSQLYGTLLGPSSYAGIFALISRPNSVIFKSLDNPNCVILYECANFHLTWVPQGAILEVELQGTFRQRSHCTLISTTLLCERYTNLYSQHPTWWEKKLRELEKPRNILLGWQGYFVGKKRKKAWRAALLCLFWANQEGGK